MADIRKRSGPKGTNYQVRYPSKGSASGYTYATFDTLKEARAFTENLGSMKHGVGGKKLTVAAAVQIWGIIYLASQIFLDQSRGVG